MKIKIETSARHVHLTKETFFALFGKEITKKADLSQPGQFLSNERVNIKTNTGKFNNVAILGPYRDYDQVEISITDAYILGLSIKIRESSNIKETPGCILEGPNGIVELKEGVIVAKRHLHVNHEEAEQLGIKDGDIIEIEVKSNRPIIFQDVIVRVSDNYSLAMHIDTDEANAAGCSKNEYGKIVKRSA